MLTKDEIEELDIHLFGSGALSYPWYYDVDVNGDVITFTVMDPNDEAAQVVKKITYEDFFTAAKVLHTQPGWNDYGRAGFTNLYARNWDELDLDADSADIVMQQAIYGEIIFG